MKKQQKSKPVKTARTKKFNFLTWERKWEREYEKNLRGGRFIKEDGIC